MASYDVRHRDARPLARSAAVRSALEQDHQSRAHVRQMTMAERLRAGWTLSSLASRMRGGRR
ncbi:MAG: hypothetical protein ACR2LV_06120 [Solirubrobacteraceae bacterium]